MRKPEQTNLDHARSIDPGFVRQILVAQNPLETTPIEVPVNVDEAADKASKKAWRSPQTLAAALGSMRVERTHGTPKNPKGKSTVHDPYGTYRAHQASIKDSDAPEGMTHGKFQALASGMEPAPVNGFNDIVTPAEVADIKAQEKYLAMQPVDELARTYDTHKPA